MSKRKGRIHGRIEDDSPVFERVSPEEVEQGLGAIREPLEFARGGSAFAVAALRRRLAGDLVSKGGRPGRREAVTIKKIPVTAAESRMLDELTELIRQDGHVKATPAQVAGMLLHESLTQLASRVDRLPDTNSEDEEMLEEILAAAASSSKEVEQLRRVARQLLKRMRAAKGIEADDKR